MVLEDVVEVHEFGTFHVINEEEGRSRRAALFFDLVLAVDA